jgi:hypothetical protein
MIRPEQILAPSAMERELDKGHNDKDEYIVDFRTLFISGTLIYITHQGDSARTPSLILAHLASNSASRAIDCL